MSFRRILTLAALTASVAIGTAQAGNVGTKSMMPTYPSYGGFTSNSVTANNVAAGFGNKAKQSVYADQSGSRWSSPTLNSVDATNLAAGFGNKAKQDITASQSGGRVPTLNSVDALNLAAGIHNFAGQQIMTQQR